MPGFGSGGGMGGGGGFGLMPNGGGNKADKKKDSGEPLVGGLASPSKYHRGGKVCKGGWAKVKRKERVLSPKQAKKYEREMKRKPARKR